MAPAPLLRIVAHRIWPIHLRAQRLTLRLAFCNLADDGAGTRPIYVTPRIHPTLDVTESASHLVVTTTFGKITRTLFGNG